MALVDADLKFIFVDVGKNGRVSDGVIWSECALKNAIENETLKIPKLNKVGNDYLPHVIVADDAFPLKPYIMKPYSSKNLTIEKRIFNYRLSRARRTVENAFGLLTSIWRVYQKPIQLTKTNAIKVVLATVVLHNMLRSNNTTRNMYSTIKDIDHEDCSTGDILSREWRQYASNSGIEDISRISSNSYSFEAKEIREKFVIILILADKFHGNWNLLINECFYNSN